MTAPIHPNAHVVTALEHLSLALAALNAADAPYAIGIDEPYGMVERAARRVLEHAAPDLDAADIEYARVDGHDTYANAIRALRAEREYNLREYESILSNEWHTDPEDREYVQGRIRDLREAIARIPA